MNKVRSKVLSLALLSLTVLTSCGNDIQQADAIVTPEGNATGVVLEYKTPIDDDTVNKEAFSVEGMTISSVFVSDVNIFKGERSDGSGDGGRYVIILLKPGRPAGDSVPVTINPGAPKVTLSVRQVSPVKTLSGKVINAWKKAIETEESHIVAR